MDVSQPPFGRQGLRTLAAIVFTDVVSFSAHMGRDEVKTLGLVNRDFTEMRRLCEARGGAVLKTTGDGLLCYFASAVEAVACALDMQKHFSALGKTLPPGDALQHRIGIHLGDVLVQDQDVMGDGVNIASRLQAEAEPGGICISQTVYDVVKNKIELKATYLGARDLKNIAQAVPVYRLLLEAQVHAAVSPPAKKSFRWLLPAVMTAVAMVLVTAVMVHAHKKALPAPAPIVALAPTPPAPAPMAASASVSAPVPATNETAASGASASAPAKLEVKNLPARREFLQEIHKPYLVPYDYDGLLQAIQTGKVKVDMANPLQFRKAIEHLSEMKAWLLERLSHYTLAQPLIVPRFGVNGEKDYKIYGAPPKNIVVISNGMPTSMDLTKVKPPFLSLILLVAIKNDPGVPSDVILGAASFAHFYNLPEMGAELQPMGGGQRPVAKPAAPTP
ncbi:MAG TPA: adenylate/guanylate cyclase domain-containing protein [Opitutaceae bacterium]|jgi:class 3 adenylate cyclase|nr:adenylate/guanylate cyclase domain-containing protein [Opitutaceae bacterium]